jgi:hypothetical protein
MEESTEKPPEPLLCTAVLIGCDPTTPPQRWANLDQASKHLEVFRFRDLSPTPKP